MTNAQVIKAFANGLPGHATNLRTDGIRLTNYNTTIAQRIEDTVVLNVTRYSNTTSKIQCALKREFPDAVQVKAVPIDTFTLHGYWIEERGAVNA